MTHGDELPVWHDATGGHVDPVTGEVLPTWDDALDAIGQFDLPWHVARFGERFDAQGVLAGSPQAARCIGYLTKYLTKQVGDCHQATTGPQHDHAARLAEALQYQPCSPRCASWLRYGIQPKNARPGLTPGACKGKAHDADHLGYAGRRVLVSRKWSGKTLADHRADRKEVKWKPPKVAELVDRRVVVNPRQARELLAAVTYVGRPWRGRHLRAFFACMYFAALRPGEVKALRRDGCYLPASGWGRLTPVQLATTIKQALDR
jgi:hypothetical protein